MKMKHFTTCCLCILGITLSATSCVENSEKYKNLQTQLKGMNQAYDSLKIKNSDLHASYNEVLLIIGKLEESFAQIREQEKSLQIELAEKGGKNQKSMNKEIIAKINLIQELLQKNRQHISNLQGKLAKMGKENSILAESILSYEKQLKDKVDMITSLHKTIEEKNLSINDLNYSVANLNRMSEELKSSIEEQDRQMHSVYYVIAEYKDLKEDRIIRSSLNKQLLAQDFNENAFTKADLRDLHRIDINSKRAKMLSTHPIDSYSLETDGNGNKFLNIRDAAKFWSISKYLVIRKS